MSLSEEIVRSSLKQHIFPFTKIDQRTEDRHVAGIVSKFHWMENRHFPETCRIASESLKPGSLPVPAQYIAAYRIVEDRTATGPEEKKKCSGCESERFTFGYVRRKVDGWISEVCYPCRKCNSGIMVDQRQVDSFRQQFEVATKTEHDAQRQRIHDEYLAREEIRKASRPSPKIIDAEFTVSPEVQQKIENYKNAHPVAEPKLIAKALVGCEDAPAPKKKYNGEEEF